jgi:hypothetical protein
MSLIAALRKLCCCAVEELGACCLPNGQCVGPISQDECLTDFSGRSWHPGVDCTNDLCDGACCVPPETPCCPGTEWCCFDDWGPEQCDACSGIYYGDGSLCANIDCGSVIGACCLPNDAGCINVEQERCTDLGGDYQGDGTTCADPEIDCVRDGACCILLWDNCGLFEFKCEFLTQYECEQQGGDFRLDVPCSPFPCDLSCCCAGPGWTCAAQGDDGCSDNYRMTLTIAQAADPCGSSTVSMPISISCLLIRDPFPDGFCSWKGYEGGEIFCDVNQPTGHVEPIEVACDPDFGTPTRNKHIKTICNSIRLNANTGTWRISAFTVGTAWTRGSEGNPDAWCTCSGCGCDVRGEFPLDPCGNLQCCPPSGPYPLIIISNDCLDATLEIG